MYLLRLAVLKFNSEPPKEWIRWEYEIDDIEIKPLDSDRSDNSVLVVSKIKINFPEITHDNRIVIPLDKVNKSEEAIESLANMISVSIREKIDLRSPIPCIALFSKDKEAYSRLEMTKGFDVSQFNPFMFIFNDYRFSPNEMEHIAVDRMSGLAILAEAISTNHLTGKFHEYQRFFELAFQASSGKLVKHLSNFLSSNGLNYKKSEIKNWLIKLRNPATHADSKKNNYFLLENDIRPVISRMEQAAYDVLMNKEEWHSISEKRRDFWTIPYGLYSRDNDIFLVKGYGIKPKVQYTDHLGTYILDLNKVIHEKPNNWWYVKSDFNIEVNKEFHILPNPNDEK